MIVADGSNLVKDPDPELTKLNTIPPFLPIMKGSLNVATSTRDLDMLDKLDHRTLLSMCLRYQDHLKQLAEAVAFDQNALCIRIKEVGLLSLLVIKGIIVNVLSLITVSESGNVACEMMYNVILTTDIWGNTY